jgi:hypothetical protein
VRPSQRPQRERKGDQKAVGNRQRQHIEVNHWRYREGQQCAEQPNGDEGQSRAKRRADASCE